jgi:hypothetical protein
MKLEHLSAAMQTATAPWWRVVLARFLGKRQETVEGRDRIVCHRWRGRLYMTNVRAVR